MLNKQDYTILLIFILFCILFLLYKDEQFLVDVDYVISIVFEFETLGLSTTITPTPLGTDTDINAYDMLTEKESPNNRTLEGMYHNMRSPECKCVGIYHATATDCKLEACSKALFVHGKGLDCEECCNLSEEEKKSVSQSVLFVEILANVPVV